MDVVALPWMELGSRLAKNDFDALLLERTSGRSVAWAYYNYHSSLMPSGYRAADERSEPAPPCLVGQRNPSRGERVPADPVRRSPALFLAWPVVARAVSNKFVVPPKPAATSWAVCGSGARVETRAMTRITSRFVLLIASAAVAPLVLYGGDLVLQSAQAGTTHSVREGNHRVARQVAEQIKQYIDPQPARVEGAGPSSSAPPASSRGNKRASSRITRSSSPSCAKSPSSLAAAG